MNGFEADLIPFSQAIDSTTEQFTRSDLCKITTVADVAGHRIRRSKIANDFVSSYG